MFVIKARNVNGALGAGLNYLALEGGYEDSRNGKVLVAPEPVATVYAKPRERVLMCPLRDANPFFHLMESLWMMAGRNDLNWPLYFNSKFAGYSDDGVTLHGAYGHRWRHAFHIDQVKRAIRELTDNPMSRRVVIGMWSPGIDMGRVGNDVPCNTHIYLAQRFGELDMTVCCRSNDALWGAYGANAVHMSILQEVIAHATGLKVGTYTQMSNNFHVYSETLHEDRFAGRAISAIEHDIYRTGHVKHFPVISVPFAEWDEDLNNFIVAPTLDQPYHDNFFRDVAAPM